MTFHMLYRRRTACFACGALTLQPCKGHEYGGLLLVWQRRPATRWVPWWLASLARSPR